MLRIVKTLAEINLLTFFEDNELHDTHTYVSV